MWVKLDEEKPHWPCVGIIRPMLVPKTEIGFNELTLEKKLYVVPCGLLNHFNKPWFHGVWLNIKAACIEPFVENYDAFKAAGTQHSSKSFVREFTLALEDCERRVEVLSLPFRFVRGSLDEISYAEQLRAAGLPEDVYHEPVPRGMAKEKKLKEKEKKLTTKDIIEQANASLPVPDAAVEEVNNAVELSKSTSVKFVRPRGYVVDAVQTYYQHLSEVNNEADCTTKPSISTTIIGSYTSNFQFNGARVSMFASPKVTSYLKIGSSSKPANDKKKIIVEKVASKAQICGKVSRKSSNPSKFRDRFTDTTVSLAQAKDDSVVMLVRAGVAGSTSFARESDKDTEVLLLVKRPRLE